MNHHYSLPMTSPPPPTVESLLPILQLHCYLYPQSLYQLLPVSQTFSRCMTDGIRRFEKRERQHFQSLCASLIHDMASITQQRSLLSEAEMIAMDTELQQCFDRALDPECSVTELTVLHQRIHALVYDRGARYASPPSHVPPYPYDREHRGLLLVDRFRHDWFPVIMSDQHPSDSLVPLVLACYRVALVSNPSLLHERSECPMLHCGHGSLSASVLEPIISRRSYYDLELQLARSSHADALYQLAVTCVLLRQILSKDIIRLYCQYDCWYQWLLYSLGLKTLIRVKKYWNRSGQEQWQPIDDRHRYQQQSLLKLIYNYYHTDEYSLQRTNLLGITARNARRDAAETIHVQLVALSVRPDLVLPMLPFLERPKTVTACVAMIGNKHSKLNALLGHAQTRALLLGQGLLWALLRDRQRTIIELVVRLQGTECLREQRSEEGDDPLMFVAKNVRGVSQQLIDFLIECGCDVNARTSDGLLWSEVIRDHQAQRQQ